MTSLLVDPENQPNEDQFASIPDDAGAPAPVTADPVVPAAAPAADELPEKFAGKSAVEIAASYADLEKELGRQAQEVGSLRTLTDQLLEVRQTGEQGHQAAPAAALPELTADDVLNDPRAVIEAVATPMAEHTSQRVDDLEQTLALNAFEGRHPTFRADQSDPAFQEFVRGGAYRQSLAAQAAQGNLLAAEELWTAWDGEVAATADPVTEDPQPTAQELEATATAEAIAARGGAETGATGPKPISRFDLDKIKATDEDRYYSPQFQAYMIDMYHKNLVK